jgi:cholest-4-en-3-one 26-monooxygenase
MDSSTSKPFLDFERFAIGTPREYMNELRAKHRILWESNDFATGGHWLVFKLADIDEVLKNTALYSSTEGPILDDFPPEVLAQQQEAMTFMDPPKHRQTRALVEYAFRPAALKAREPRMRALANELLDAALDKGQCEFVSQVAMQFPMRVMYDILGVPERDYDYVVERTNAALLADDPEFVSDRQLGFQASLDLLKYGASLAADHRINPRNSMTMEVLGTKGVDAEMMSDLEFGRFFMQLISGGLETTRNTLAYAFYEFWRHPDQYKAIQANPSLVAGAVEEILRFRNPVVYLRRTATMDHDFAGERIRKGDKMVCLLGSPNRDPELFENPDVFDITRNPLTTRQRIRTFGLGPHYCLGIHQARLNLNVMLEEFARRVDNPRVLAEPRYARSIFMDGFKELLVAMERRAS